MAREEGFFDDLARGLADGTITRGKALRLMGAALLGGTLASLGIGGEASADPPGCKRAGKHCTRDTQCCGSLVCLSGTCQTQTTTPTPTPSTTETPATSTSTTSTSTSTTSTTTPMCLPNGGSCEADSECCSRICESGTCAACRSNGGSCGPCCSGFCSGSICACRPQGFGCSSTAECCSGLSCDPISHSCQR
jgi:hypothetical protein